MKVPDTSVVVAGFASWHEHHRSARMALSEARGLIAHCALETYSVLTRLPAPHRAPADLVRRFLHAQFPAQYLALSPSGHRTLIDRLADLGITGGAAYDALVAATAAENEATLVSCDRRAIRTYERWGIGLDLIGADPG